MAQGFKHMAKTMQDVGHIENKYNKDMNSIHIQLVYYCFDFSFLFEFGTKMAIKIEKECCSVE